MSYNANPDAEDSSHNLGKFLNKVLSRSDGNPDPDSFLWGGMAIRTENLSIFSSLYARCAGLIQQIHTESPESLRPVLSASMADLMFEIRLMVISKNSETIADGQAISSIQNRVARQSIEHVYTGDVMAKKSLMERLKGEQKEPV